MERAVTAALATPDLRTEAFIDGAFVASATGARIATFNPATGTMLADVAACDDVDVDVAVAAARRAFESGEWSRMPPSERKEVLLRFASLIDEHTEELALLDALDAGKPITDCREIDIPETAKTFRWYAEAVDKLYDSVAPTGPDNLGLILREPVGVVAAVLPWNFPAMMAAWKAAPALAAGNSVILKPAELSPLSTLRMAELAAEAGIPRGVLNVVPGMGERAGRALGLHPGVDVVTFTGSAEVGRLFLQYSAASNLKGIVLECGGKSPQVVMADAGDLDVVADDVVTAGFWNMGENCTCGSRLLVDRSIQDELLERIVERTKDWPIGDPLEPATRIGPMIEPAHHEKVLGYIASGNEQGATLVVGGAAALEDTGGWFVEPTVFSDVTPEMQIARDEIFGPVISVLPFDSTQEAIALANDTNYGLAASVWTKDIDLAIRLSRSIKAGTISVNCYSEGDLGTPFGGFKESGFGGRDKGMHAFDQYTEVKTVWVQCR
jgi:gamma-glutamyl-gamma-aminobutyraldehyde dehydrogenase